MALVPLGVATVMSCVPEPAGAVAVIWLSLTTLKFVAGFPAPNSTSVAPVNPLPLTVTVFPPAPGP